MDLERRLARLLGAVEAALEHGAKDRYAMAMMGRALAVARRDLEGGIDRPERELNLAVYGEPMQSLDRLAKDVRDRAITDDLRQDLLTLLSRYVEERLKRWNPDIL